MALPTSLAETEDKAIVSRFQDYLRINTVHPNPDYCAAADFIISQAHSISLQYQSIELVQGKPIVLLKWIGSDPSLPAILLNSHTDVVPFEADKWDHPPLGAEMDEDGRIYARGTQDMKSVGMQYLEAIRKLIAYGVGKFVESEIFKSLSIAIVLDEGKHTCHANKYKKIVYQWLRMKQALPSPPEGYRVLNGERTQWSLQIKAVGQPGHGAKLYDDSAAENLTKSIESMMRFRASQFDLLKAGLKPGGGVISVNMVFLKAGTPSPDCTLLSPFSFTHDGQNCIFVNCDLNRTKLTFGFKGFVMNLQPSEAEAGFDIRIPPTADLVALEKRLVEEWEPLSRNMSFELWRFDQNLSLKQLLTAKGDSNPWWGLLENAVNEAGGKTINRFSVFSESWLACDWVLSYIKHPEFAS